MSSWLYAGLTPVSLYLSSVVELRSRNSIPDIVTPLLKRGKITSLNLPAMVLSALFLGALLAYGQLALLQDLKVLICRASFQKLSPEPVMVHRNVKTC